MAHDAVAEIPDYPSERGKTMSIPHSASTFISMSFRPFAAKKLPDHGGDSMGTPIPPWSPGKRESAMPYGFPANRDRDLSLTAPGVAPWTERPASRIGASASTSPRRLLVAKHPIRSAFATNLSPM